MPMLGVNIDHVATLRQARGGAEPDPLKAAGICEDAGCDSIVAHLREDRRHINDRDVFGLKKKVKTRFNLEMSIDREIVRIATRLLPDQATLVPEKRKELTTEGGMSVIGNEKRIGPAIEGLLRKGIEVSIFIDPDLREIRAVRQLGVDTIEIHTGRYSGERTAKGMIKEFGKIKDAAEYALSLGLTVNAGHGLNYRNVKKIAMIKGINELNIGHSIISEAVFSGLFGAVRKMKGLAA